MTLGQYSPVQPSRTVGKKISNQGFWLTFHPANYLSRKVGTKLRSITVIEFHIIRLYFYKLVLRERETEGIKGTSKSVQ